MTALRNIKEVSWYTFGPGSIASLNNLVDERRHTRRADAQSTAVFLVDQYFAKRDGMLPPLGRAGDAIRFVSTANEPTTDGIDAMVSALRSDGYTRPSVIVGIGGGITLDTAKAIAILYTNPGRAETYQGWDLVEHPSLPKIGVPTLSGTGAESSRTCVLTNTASGLKLGMNSDHTLFDQLVLDPVLTATVDRNQYFYTGMDTYIHGIESLAGHFRNSVGDALSRTSVDLCREVFLGVDMMSDRAREQLMTASYLGGRAIATGFVGVVHPVSAALSVVLGTHHCVANCITMTVMDEFYPAECREFRRMVAEQNVTIPTAFGRQLITSQLDRMVASTLMHDKPLANALGPDFTSILTPAKLRKLFRRM